MIDATDGAERRRVAAAAGAIEAAETLLANGHLAVVEDALALLHRHVLDAPSLDAVAPLAGRPALNASLRGLRDRHAVRLFTSRVAGELLAAFAVAAHPSTLRRRRWRNAFDHVGRLAASSHAPTVFAVVAWPTFALALAGSALAWRVGAHDPPGRSPWAYDGAWGCHDARDMLAVAFASVGFAGVVCESIRAALRRTPPTATAHAVEDPRPRSTAEAVARLASRLAGAVALTGVAATVAAGGPRVLVGAIVAPVLLTFASLPVIALGKGAAALVRWLARGADALLATVPGPVAASAAPWRESPLTSPGWAARWRVERAIATRLRASARRAATKEREARRVASLAAKFREGMAPASDEAVDPVAPPARTGYREAPAAEAPAARVDNAIPSTTEATLALLSDPATGPGFRADLLADCAESASAQRSTEDAVAIVEGTRRLLALAASPMAATELRAIARVASRRQGGFWRLRRITGEVILTEDDRDAPGVRVAVERRPENDAGADEGASAAPGRRSVR